MTDVGAHPPAGMAASRGLFQYHQRSIFAVDTIASTASTGSLYHDPSDSFEVFSLAFAHDSRYLAAGGANSVVRVFTPRGAHVLNLVSDGQALPCTRLCFRPAAFASNAQHVLLAVCADGSLTHWHVPTQTCLFRHEEPDNQVFAADFAADGSCFATAGRDARVRVYDEGTKLQTHTLQAAAASRGDVQGHTNRVFAVKFSPTEPDLLVSGGWDNTVRLWDLRSGRSERALFGPHVCGDALDIDCSGRRLLTGSCRPDNAVQVWDLASGKVELELEGGLTSDHAGGARTAAAGDDGEGGPRRPLMPYACAFSPDGRWVAAGGSGDANVRVYDVSAGQTHPQTSVTAVSLAAAADSGVSPGAGAGSGKGSSVAFGGSSFNGTGFGSAGADADAGVGACVDEVPIDAKGVYALSWSKDGRYLAAAGKGLYAAVVNEVYHMHLPSR